MFFKKKKKSEEQKPKIMVVDDEPSLLELVKAILELENFEVITASSGKEALDKLTKVKPDLVLLDIMMPSMTGFDVCEEMRANPKTKKQKVFFLTALKMSMIEKSYLNRFNALAYITKPFDNDDLIKQIKTAL
jgi:two-component system response regulator VicR